MHLAVSKLPIKQVHFDNADMSLKIFGVLYHHFYLLFAPMKFWEFAILSGNCMMDNTCCRAVIDPKTANSLLIRGFTYAEQTFKYWGPGPGSRHFSICSSEFTYPNSHFLNKVLTRVYIFWVRHEIFDGSCNFYAHTCCQILFEFVQLKNWILKL